MAARGAGNDNSQQWRFGTTTPCQRAHAPNDDPGGDHEPREADHDGDCPVDSRHRIERNQRRRTTAHPKGITIKLPDQIPWKRNAAGSNETAVLYGDPTKSGTYVYRSKFAPGSKNMPHWHPEERTVAILSGTLYYGLGEQWDDTKLIALPAGTFLAEPPNTPHFTWAKDGEVILQVTGIGPSGTTLVQSLKP